MSAFRFEEATALVPAIATLEQERQALAASVPVPEPETGVVPVLARPRKGRTRRMG
jgi:2-keto-3-deoxy-L-rhamnonate aldolase RhmA